MKGRLVSLGRPSDRDYERMADWLGPDAPVSALTADFGGLITPEDIKRLNHSGEVRQFAVRDQSGTTVGMVNYRKAGASGGYALGGAIGDPELWNQGMGTEAFDLLIDHLFHTMGAHRVQFTTALYNKAMIKLATRAGFVLEGILRDYIFFDGRHHHAAIWAIVRREYYEAVDILTRTSHNFVGPDVIPEEEKQEALDILRAHLRRPESETSVRLLLDQVAPHPAHTEESQEAQETQAAETHPVSQPQPHAQPQPQPQPVVGS
ncbi:GNAT family N-acetyltransferase [Streptomyces iconiensis]|uniref:GNAT family protein n=1 Tax=Streptomyces iconiensis TaxID=1384038 RepID=A0ABT7A642_9ACTN|nr:GNAT family protein [Streptomyces iconiensis]MDJ1136542.1 GNAT family protein [Streptomyces iconiensis]